MEHWRHGRSSASAPDLIIGAGHKVHFAMLMSRLCCGGRTVVLMKPSLPTAMFDLVFVPEHDQVLLDHKVVRTEGMLCPVSIDTKDVERGVIMLGGPSRHFHWDEQAVVNAIHDIVYGSKDMRWVIADSRRTPESTRAMLVLPANADLINHDECPPGWLTRELAAASNVWVTADSASMLYEAMSSGASVGIIELAPTRQDDKLAKGVDRLASRGLVGLSSRVKNLGAEYQVQPLREHLRCSDLLLRRWFPQLIRANAA